jgi:hypothetical protein
MSQVSQAEAAASGGSARGNKDGAGAQATEERFTTLRSREEHTFSQMRIDRGGPRSFSALCFRGWRRD